MTWLYLCWLNVGLRLHDWADRRLDPIGPLSLQLRFKAMVGSRLRKV
jgi:hypothetical protein